MGHKRRTIDNIKKSSTKRKKLPYGESKGKQGDEEFEMVQKQLESFDPRKWEEAIDHKRQMSIFTDDSHDPDAKILKKLKPNDIGLFAGDVNDIVTVEPSENPDENGSFGFVGSFANVSSNLTFIPGTLILRFNPKQLGSVARGTLRLFWWNETTQSFQMIGSSHVSENGDYVWGRITSPGKYAIIGLNAHPLVIRTAKVGAVLSDLMSSLTPDLQRELQERICKLILKFPEMHKAIEEPQVLKSLIQGSIGQGFPNPKKRVVKIIPFLRIFHDVN
jgi:hypothetical protein